MKIELFTLNGSFAHSSLAMRCLKTALEEAGFNKQGNTYIPVFGVDATEAAKAKINTGAMTGTVKQDGALMAEVIARIAANMLEGRKFFDGVDEDMVAGIQRVNIPYSAYTGESEGE